jgi:hypothetical protein
LIEVLRNESQKEYVSPNEIALHYALMGDRDHTFEWLERDTGAVGKQIT